MKFISGILKILLICPGVVYAGSSGKSSPNFLKNKDLTFLVGFKGGMNFSIAIPTQRYSVIQVITGDPESGYRKDYSLFFKNTGYQYGFIGALKIGRYLNLSLEPTFSTYSFRYKSQYAWYDSEDRSDRIEVRSDFTDKLRYFEIPLIIRYELGSGTIRPYLSASIFYGILTGASGTALSTTSQYIDDVETGIDRSENAGDITGNYIHSRLAITPGAGVFADISFGTLFAEAGYNITLHNITDESSRFSNQQSVGSIYNVPDNIRFENLVINLGILFNINQLRAGGSGKGRATAGAVDCPVPRKKR